MRTTVEGASRRSGLSGKTRRSLSATRPRRPLEPVPRLALTRAEAAQALGMGVTSFEQYVQPEVRCIRRGSLRLFLPDDLARWAAQNAGITLGRSRR
jgi:hypothetical protein